MSLNLHPNSIKIISDFTGNDLSQIDNELEKLKLNSKKEQIITPDEVENIIGFSKEYNFFELKIFLTDTTSYCRCIRKQRIYLFNDFIYSMILSIPII